MMYNNIINKIRLNYKYNKKKIILNINKKNELLIKELVKINLIFVIKKNKQYTLFLKYYKNKPLFKNIIYTGGSSNLKFISLKNIKKINHQKNWIFFLNTNLGLINNFEAEKRGVGGIIILKIWN